MVFSAVAWAYKDVITSTKLAQMVENTRTHDHRADGSQGAPFKLFPPDVWHVVQPKGTAVVAPEIAFVNNWGHAIYSAFADTRFVKNAAGDVEIRGALWEQYGAANGTVAFTLPPGYRPQSPVSIFGTHTGAQPALYRLDIATNGDVTPTRTSGPDPGGTGYTVHARFSTL